MPRRHRHRGVSQEHLMRSVHKLEQVRQSPNAYATTADDDTVAGFVFDIHQGLAGLSGRGISRARLMKAHVQASRKSVTEVALHTLNPTSTLGMLTETFASIQRDRTESDPNHLDAQTWAEGEVLTLEAV